MELNSNFKKNGDINENKELKKIKNKKKKLKLRKIFKIVKHFHKHHNHNENENENENDNSIKNSKDYYSSVHPSAADYEKSSYFHRKESGSAENASKSADGSATESATESAVDATKITAKHEAKQDDNDQAEKLQLDNEEIRHDTAEFADSSAGDPAGSDVGHAGHGNRAGEDDSQHDTPAEDDGNAKQADDRAVAGPGKEIPVDYDKFYSESGQKDGPEDGPHYSPDDVPDDVPGSGLKDGPENVVSGDSPARDQQAEAWGDAVDDHAPLQRAGSVVGRVKDKLKALV
ncbi:unnamed protein product [[Candida] boidinii]|nr:unnamed protein product [[Candida] boidinii]